MITISKDGKWRMFDTSVDYEKEQEPYLIHSGSLTVGGFSFMKDPALISLSADAKVAAVACGTSIAVFSTITGDFIVFYFQLVGMVHWLEENVEIIFF